jgi:hypothetical protein
MALITGTNQPDTIDLLSVSPGVVGGPATIGADTVNVGNGADNVSTGAGDDTIHGERGNDIINAGAGDDFIDGGQGNDTIETGEGNDTVVLSKNGGIDTVTDFRAVYYGPDQTITFDDLTPSSVGDPVPNGYGGLNWSNVYEVDADSNIYNPSGFQNVAGGSDGNVAFNGFSNLGTITTAGADFTLKSAYMAAAWNDGLQVTVEGYDDGVLVATQIITREPVTFVGFDSVDTFRCPSRSRRPVYMS